MTQSVASAVAMPSLRTCSSEEIYSALPAVGEAEIEDLLANPVFSEAHLIAWLRQPHLPAAVLERIRADDRFFRKYRVKVALVNHPALPKIEGLQMVRFLFWRDLLRLSENSRILPQLRRVAESLLADQVTTLTPGEKISLARLANRAVIRFLRTECDERVIEALLQNPRLTEEDVLFIASRGTTPRPILVLVHRSPRWASTYPVRLALTRNPSFPLPLALSILPTLQTRDLQGIASAPALPPTVREGARAVLDRIRDRQ